MTETLFTVREVVEKWLVWYKARTVRKLINSKKSRSVNLSNQDKKINQNSTKRDQWIYWIQTEKNAARLKIFIL